jgi:hypothetical protein
LLGYKGLERKAKDFAILTTPKVGRGGRVRQFQPDQWLGTSTIGLSTSVRVGLGKRSPEQNHTVSPRGDPHKDERIRPVMDIDRYETKKQSKRERGPSCTKPFTSGKVSGPGDHSTETSEDTAKQKGERRVLQDSEQQILSGVKAMPLDPEGRKYRHASEKKFPKG